MIETSEAAWLAGYQQWGLTIQHYSIDKGMRTTNDYKLGCAV